MARHISKGIVKEARMAELCSVVCTELLAAACERESKAPIKQ